MLAAVASAISAGFAAFACLQALRQLTVANKAVETTTFLEIGKEWNRIYPIYRELVNLPFDYESVIARYPKFADLTLTDDWLRMRSVFAFYEFLGACIRAKLIREHTLFALVTVNAWLWEKYKPLILHYRSEAGRPDLYVGWQYLTERRNLRFPGVEHLPMRWSLFR